MNGTAARFVRLGVSLVGLVTLGWVLTGQAAKPARHGIPLPTDWSHRHLIFSRPASPELLARVSEDPRYWQQLYRRGEWLALPGGEKDAGVGTSFGARASGITGKSLQPDWSVDLGAGASVGAGNYPAKFSFDLTTANCSTDYVVYNTSLAGSGTQASIAAFNNMYSGCGGTVPSVFWAYNTAGTVLTSPIISLDGKQVAFVETNGGFGILVMLKWAASTGTISLPATPTLVTPALYSACVAPCMAQILLRNGSGIQTDDTTSSVFYDYTNDVAWVGGALGWLHKITGVFKGIPAEVTTGGFPVQVNNTLWISSPVFDRISGNVFVGDASGFVYSVNAATAAVTASAQLDFGAGVVDAPVVDTAKGFVYVFASSDGTSNCVSGTVACAAVYQLSTGFTAGATGTEVTVGDSVAFGTLPDPNPLYIGGFDSAYYGSGTATGNLYVCGNTGANPTLFRVPIQAGVLPAAGTAISTLTTLASTAACSSVTDVPNANTTGGASERLFVGVRDHGRPTACAGHGCIESFVDMPWQATTAYVVGQETLNPKLHIETVVTAGTSGATPPSWTNSTGTLRTDGTVVWMDQGALTAFPLTSWLATHFYPKGARILDTNQNIQVATAAGTTGALEPAWNAAVGGLTPDAGITWKNAGALPTHALPSLGGTSGIISDNVVAPGTLTGTSQVYFSTLADQTCATSGGTGGCATQASQPALQ